MSFLMLVGLIISAISISIASQPATQSQTLPGCDDPCGDIQIPYPFGTSMACSYNENFVIACNNSYNPPLPVLGGNIVVTDVTTTAGEIHILHCIARECYDQLGKLLGNFWTLLNLPTPFTISATRNKFIVIGCNVYALLRGYRSNEEMQLTADCNAVCGDDNSDGDNVNGVCRAEIPKGLRNITVAVRSYNNRTDLWEKNPCGYAFVGEENRFNFSSKYYSNYTDKWVPLVADWVIENERCDDAKKKPNYACAGKGTSCFEPDNEVHGYRCKCLDGYHGNPYLPEGCSKSNNAHLV